MRAKPISVRFPIPKAAAAKLRDLAISRDPRLLELGVLAVQITEHEKIVVSFGKPPYGKTKQRPNTPKTKRARVKAVRRNRPKTTTSVTCPVSAASIAFPGIVNRLQERHLNNKKVITDKSNTKVARPASKDQVYQAVGRHRNIKSTSATQRDSKYSAVHTLTTAKNVNVTSRNNIISSNLSKKQVTALKGLDNKNHNVFPNGEDRRSRAELGPVEGAKANASPCPSDASSLSLSSTSPLIGEDRNSSSCSSHNEQTCFSLTGIQEVSYMGRQRAMFDWFMNSSEKKFSASNKLRELARGHSIDGKKNLPESSSLRKSATSSSTNFSFTESTVVVPRTSSTFSSPTSPVSASANTRSISTPTPGIHCVKMSKKSLSGLASMPHFSVKESLSGNQTNMSIRTSPNNKSNNEKSISLVENLEHKSKKDLITNSSEIRKCWTPSSKVISNVAANNMKSVNFADETYNAVKNCINDTFNSQNCLANKVTLNKVQCKTSANTKTETSFGDLELINKSQANVEASIKPHCNDPISINSSQVLNFQTVDTNNNQAVSKTPLMYPYSTSLLSSPFPVASKVTAIPGVVLGLQYASVKPQVSTIPQIFKPSQLAAEINAKPSSGADEETVFSSTLEGDTKKIDLVSHHSEASNFQELVNNQLCHKGLNSSVSTLYTNESCMTTTSISNSQLSFSDKSTSSVAFVASPSVSTDPQPSGVAPGGAEKASNLYTSSNPPAVVSSTYANQQTTWTPTGSVTFQPIAASLDSNRSCIKTINAQNPELFLVAKQKLQQQSGQQLADAVQQVKTEDQSKSIQGLQQNKLSDSQILATTPIQFIDLSGTWRYWQQWSLYYKSLIEKQNAVAALLSMQNPVPAATAVTTAVNLHGQCMTNIDAGLSSTLSSSLDQKKNVIQVAKDEDSERQNKVQQDDTDIKLLSDPVFIEKFKPDSKLQEMMCNNAELLVANGHSETKEGKGYQSIEISPPNSNNDFSYNRESSTEAGPSSLRKSVIVESRTNKLGFTAFDESSYHIDANCLGCETFERTSAKLENSSMLVGENCNKESSNNNSKIENTDIDSTTQEFVSAEEKFAEMLKAEQVIDLNLTTSLATLDNDGEIELMSLPRRLQRSRSNSNPLPPELSFIPESAIECVNVGSSKRASNVSECAPAVKKRRSKRLS